MSYYRKLLENLNLDKSLDRKSRIECPIRIMASAAFRMLIYSSNLFIRNLKLCLRIFSTES